jgi:hypothetical protein
VKALAAVAALLVALAAPAAARAATYHVDQGHPKAADTNPGTEAAPFKTLGRPLGIVGPGDTVLVKNGTYDPAPSDAFRVLSPGRPGAPIAVRAYTPPSGPRHTPVLTRALNPRNNSPVILIGGGRHHVTWDGFTLAPKTDILVVNSDFATIENMRIDKGAEPSRGGMGNYNGIWVQQSTGTVIRNNVITNVVYTGDRHHNAAAIVLFDTRRTHVHHNEISHANAGIYDKEGGVENLFELNHIHDVHAYGIVVSAFTTSRCGECPVRGTHVRQNVIVGAPSAIAIQFGRNIRDLHVYNNTIHDVRQGVVLGGPAPGMALYNNIVHVNGAPNAAHYALGRETPPDLVSRYSNFHAAGRGQPRFAIDFNAVGLRQWQARGWDPMPPSTAVDPRFVGPLTSADGFRLGPGSPLREAGRVGGVPEGAPVAMGAFVRDDDVVGPLSADRRAEAAAEASPGRSGQGPPPAADGPASHGQETPAGGAGGARPESKTGS